MSKDILGKALLDYHNLEYTEDIITYSSLDEEDQLPLPYMFRNFKQMPILEQVALGHCKGTVLDVGCGAGNHSLYLQGKGFEVTGLDASVGAISVCKQRGLLKTIHTDFLRLDGQKYDTLLLLMNGIGITGKLKNLDTYLNQMKRLLQPNGQVLLDSSDILYMYESDEEDGGYWIPQHVDYYGEVTFTMRYKNEESEPFDWLYVDFNTLKRAATFNGLNCEMVKQGESDDYLARLTFL
ncbi:MULTISPECIES: class I SAM-dependent methyltransferase [Maribacter]|uniref:Class I SAM-dependent methyltransferase n=1 Tax=Maribacter flavus TaxID=1658664 RepID=A0ABU7IHC6_9FLAO|nr:MULTISPECIES: class I SAM-dependent methyltransferase [Maribacter]MDC6404911.1 class I SAM-dependent methyltransferase [Maribacter sp. PR66]MEE1972325.1 class I SAM-dependent methyltransferase [Maribacter flavus]